jgi:predicted nucleic acid-binding protein
MELRIYLKKLNENHITGKNDEERSIIELAFRYMTQRIKKHIAEKIGRIQGKLRKQG